MQTNVRDATATSRRDHRVSVVGDRQRDRLFEQSAETALERATRDLFECFVITSEEERDL
jgi:hypothetical protein